MRYLNIAAICMLVLTASIVSATTYRWVDDDGVVHYSDSPQPGSQNPEAQVIDIPDANVIKSRRTPPSASPARAAADPAATEQQSESDFGYRALRIIAPADGDTLWNIGGSLNVSVQLSPGLRPNHGVLILLDGKLAVDAPVAGTSMRIDNVYRGEHRLTAIVRSPDGQDLITSAPVRFFVQQRSVN